MAAGNAGEIAEPAGRMREQQFGVVALRQVVDKPKRQQMGQMADGREDLVVFLRTHVDHGRATRLPRGTDELDSFAAALGQWRQHHLALDVEIGEGRLDPALLGPRNRMGRHDLGQAMTEVAPDRGNHVALGAAGVGDDRTVPQMRRHGRHDRVHLTHRCRQQHEVRITQGLGPVRRDLVDHTERQGALERLAPATDADDMSNRLRTLQPEGKGAADESDSADDELVDQGHRPGPASAQRAPEGGDEALVLLGQTDRHP